MPGGAHGDPLRRVAVVIVSYRSAEHLARLLPELPRHRLAAVVVVDNDSGDGSVEVARSVDGVHVVAHGANVGFGAGCNLGEVASPADADLVLFLNPDASIAAADLERLVGHLDRHPSCALVGPRVFRGDEPLPSAGGEAGVRTELRRFAPLFVARRLPERRLPAAYDVTGPVTYVEGACMLVRRAVFREVGRFDPAYFLFFEELDLARRLRAAGWSVELVADARAEHAVAASRATAPDRARPALVESTVRYLERRHGRSRAAWFVLLARVCWWIRVRRGQLSPDERRSYLVAARRATGAVSASR